MRKTMMVAAILVAAVPPAWAQEPSLAEAEARLAAINTLARKHYARARDAALADGPVIVVGAESVTLIHNGRRESPAYLPARYHHMKALGHVALGLWALLEVNLGRPLEGEARAALAAYREQLDGLLPHVGTLGLRWDDAKRQREILATSSEFIAETLKAGRVEAQARAAWADAIGPALLGNAYDAAEAQLVALHGLVEGWKAALPQEDWARLLTADNVTTAEGGIEVLAAAVNDRRLASDFFRDSERLSRGLLSDATARHLDRLLGP